MHKTKKLNARITPEIDAKLRELVEATGSSMSAVVMKAIELFYRQGSVPSGRKPYDLARQSGIIGCLKSGPGNLSSNYKEIVYQEIAKRHGHR